MSNLLYSIFPYNHRGEKLLSVWWFFILALVGLFIIVGTLLFYSADVDLRKTDSKILSEKLFYCISDNGFLKEDFYIDSDYTRNNCGLSDIIYVEGSDYYYEIKLFLNNEEVKDKEFYGDSYLEKNCYIDEKKGENLPRCTFFEKNVIYENKFYNVKILTASNMNGGRVSLNG
jgi:hypothetical protein